MSTFGDFMIGEAVENRERMDRLQKQRDALAAALREAKHTLESDSIEYDDIRSLLQIIDAALAAAEGQS